MNFARSATRTAAIAAVDAVVGERASNAFSLSRPPGHHCLRNRPMGFCLLANIPIAIEAERAKHDIERVAVIDWDVHHGNGTQSIYYEDPHTLTISLHQDRCFPPGYSGEEDRGAGAGVGANLNVPLLAGSGDDAYRYAFERIVLPALERFSPELIVVASGLDASAVDPLARMQLHSDSYRSMTCAVTHAAQRHCAGRLAIVHEGGYSEAYVPFCGLAIAEELGACAPRSSTRCSTWRSRSNPANASAHSSAGCSTSSRHRSACDSGTARVARRSPQPLRDPHGCGLLCLCTRNDLEPHSSDEIFPAPEDAPPAVQSDAEYHRRACRPHHPRDRRELADL
jgi:acetoin utilization deacetylase AcuC-like enzyme